jgi:hypothetical protein
MICIKPWLYIATTPKCGTISLQDAYRPTAAGILTQPVRAQHMNVEDIRRFHREFGCHEPELQDHGEVTVVATVRDPVDWLGSFHRYLADRGWGRYDTTGLTFEAFVRRWLAGANMWMEPYRTLGDYANGADRVFDVTELDALSFWIADVTGEEPARIAHRHRSKRRSQTLPTDLVEQVYAVNKVRLR